MRVILKNVRLAFSDSLFVATQFKGEGNFRHSASFIVTPGSDNDKAIESAIKIEAEKAFGKKAEAQLKSMKGQSIKYCYSDGDSKPDYDGFPGNLILASHRQSKDGAPNVINRDKSPVNKDSGIVYAGCFVNASVDIYCQATGNPGVRCGLLAVQFFADGDAFGGGSRSTGDEFDVLEAADDLL